MKRIFVTIVFCVLSAFVLPLSIFYVKGEVNIEYKDDLNTPEKISVYMHNEKRTISMPLEEYLCGVVCAEMPATFETEALKAQAVAARSYACYKQKEGSQDHPEAAVCTDYSHCKAYKPLSEARKNWGKDSDKFQNKIKQAVMETRGEVLTYDGEVALTVFHSQTGGGRTENSSDVWGGDIPYLVSVESHGEENAPNFYSTVKLEFSEFYNELKKLRPDLKISGPQDIGEIKNSEGGSVKTIFIGGIAFSGREIRTAFNLRSTCFNVVADENYVTFEVAGYGHGVGMSQYGANAMAKEGKNYKDILFHYYSGTQIGYV